MPFNLQSESIGAAPSGNLQGSLTLGPKISACTQLGMFPVASEGFDALPRDWSQAVATIAPALGSDFSHYVL